jgi:hypothetical protein
MTLSSEGCGPSPGSCDVQYIGKSSGKYTAQVSTLLTHNSKLILHTSTNISAAQTSLHIQQLNTIFPLLPTKTHQTVSHHKSYSQAPTVSLCHTSLLQLASYFLPTHMV